MVLTTTTIDRTVDGGSTVSTVQGTSARACATGGSTGTVMSGYQQLVDHRATAELRAASFVEGRVWLRPATDVITGVIAPTTPGHLAWSPPT